MSDKIILVKTGEVHSNGWAIYRAKGTAKTSSSMGLAGVYYAFDGDTMYRCGKAYKDAYGCFDGEPIYSINNYIMEES